MFRQYASECNSVSAQSSGGAGGGDGGGGDGGGDGGESFWRTGWTGSTGCCAPHVQTQYTCSLKGPSSVWC